MPSLYRPSANGAPTSSGRPVGLIAAAVGVGVMVLFFAVYSPYEPAGPDWSPRWPREANDPAIRLWDGFGQPGVDFASNNTGGAWVRLTASPVVRPGVSWTTADLPAHRTVHVRARWRGYGVVPGEYRYQTARLILAVTDEDGRWRWDVPHVAASLAGTRGWHEAGRRLRLPDWATTARLAVAHGGVSGVVEVAEFEAVPQRRRGDAPWVIGVWWLAWLAGAAMAVRRLDLLRRRGGRSVVAVGALILIAVTMPETWFHPIELLVGGRPPGDPRPTSTRHSVEGVKPAPTAPGGPSRPPPPAKPSRRFPWRAFVAGLDFHAIAHVVLFAALAGAAARCFHLRLVERRSDRRNRHFTVAGLLVYGVATEVIQYLTVTRGPGIRGAMLNWIGIGLGLILHEVITARTSDRPGQGDRIGPPVPAATK